MSRILQIGLLFYIVVIFSNCRDESIDQIIINVEDDFYIDMFEDISNGEKLFHITLKSIHNQDCLNSIIDYSLDVNEDDEQIILSINNILAPETCDPGNAPAFVSIPFENLKEQDYEIHINLKDVIFNKGTLFASSENYRLIMLSKDGFELLHDNLYKIPQKTIWGYVGYAEESGRMDSENFIKDLENLVTNISIAPIEYNTGFYGYFSINQDLSIFLEDVEDNFQSSFIFYDENDSQSEIFDLIEQYCDLNLGLNFYIFDAEGGELNCP